GAGLAIRDRACGTLPLAPSRWEGETLQVGPRKRRFQSENRCMSCVLRLAHRSRRRDRLRGIRCRRAVLEPELDLLARLDRGAGLRELADGAPAALDLRLERAGLGDLKRGA